MIDVHCHILPGIDDGPADILESIDMAAMAARDGISAIVATPHVKDRIYPAEIIQAKVDELNTKLTERNIPVKILRGADVNALLAPSLLRDYTINGTNNILYEFPHGYLPKNSGEILFNAILAGLQPIITHPERNASVLRDPNLVIELTRVNALVQITAGSLTGYFGPEVRECAIYLLKKGVVDIIATDAHSTYGRIPVLSEGLKVAEKIVGRDNAIRMVKTNPEAVISGLALNVQ